MSTRLLSLQNWMQALIQQPHLPRVGIEVVIGQSVGINAEQRLAIYQRSYTQRLLECMRAEYPLLIKAFSSDWFDMMAQRYLAAHPSSSTNLNDLGAGFVDFLQHDRPDKHQDDDVDAFDYLISLANLERYRTETNRGMGSENSDFDSFLLLESHDLETLNIELAPNVRLLRTPFQLLESLHYLNEDERPALVHQEQFIAVCRECYRTQYFKLKPWQFALLDMLRVNPNAREVITQIDKQYHDQAIYGFAPIFLQQAASKGCLLSVTCN
jgi:hypothetical protein